MNDKSLSYSVPNAISSVQRSSAGGSYYGGTADFAPTETDRKLTKYASMTTEVEQGTFNTAETQLKNIVTSSGSYLLNQNTYTNTYGNADYKQGSYYLKVDATKYDAVVSQLKTLGEVKSFTENTQDITGTYINVKLDLEAEQARLKRYQEMYNQATLIADKITLNDQMYDQERRISYLQDSMTNVNQQVSYSSISISLTEKHSSYAEIAFTKFSTLVKQLVASINSLFTVIFVVAPYAFVVLLILFFVRLFKRRHG